MAKVSTKDYLKTKKYSIGLDIGTNSVGWAVVDENMNLIKRCKKHLWGSRLFEERSTAVARRKFRTARRRLLRRRVRMAMLDNIFAPFINDENFFARLKESFLQIGDRSQRNKNILFDDNCTCEIVKSNGEIITISSDADYYKEFPTIYHLRRSIIEHADWQFDPKLIYLAVHHILKSRGNFINEEMGAQDDEKSGESETLNEVLQNASALFELDFDEDEDFGDNEWLRILNNRAGEFLQILQDKSLSKKEKQAKIEADFNCKKENKQIAEMCKLLIGYKANLKNIFPEKFEDKADISLSEAGIDEKIANFGDCAEFLTSAKNLYSQIEFARLMSGKKYLSDLMISRYERYKSQLKDLKSVFLAIFPRQNGKMHPEYRKFFRDLKTLNNYARYTYSVGACEPKSFYDNIESIIEKNADKIISVGVCQDCGESFVVKAKEILVCINSKLVAEGKKMIFADINLPNFNRDNEVELGFLQRPRVAGNGIFPKQAHEKELNKILENQGKIWGNFLSEKVQSDIKELFKFKIDYFVGPLGIRKDDNKQNFGWVKRNAGYENEQITPFNYEKAIDFEATRKAFIERMTGTCSYLIGEKALPTNSMYYCYFNVLNEISNLSVIRNKTQEKLGDGLRNKIINRLLKTNTYKQKDVVKGFADGDKFNSNLKSIRDMVRIVCKTKLTANTIMEFLRSPQAKLCEEIIYNITIFGESKKSLKQSLDKYIELGQLTDRQVKELCALQYKGWGNLSEKLIFGIKSQDESHLTILELMEQEKKNFMSIYSNKKYGFQQQVEEYLSKCKKDIPEMIEELACSPRVKRGITQAYKVVEELVRVMGHAPENVFMEFARGEDLSKKGNISQSRQKQIKKKYEEAKKLSKELYEQLISNNADIKSNLADLSDSTKSKDFDNEKVVLYFLQAGKCMYTGKPLSLNNLSEYDVDHIVPRSLTTDNSFDNKVLVTRYANNEKRDCETVPSQFKQFGLWKSLKNLGLLTSEKYARLVRVELSEKDKSGFIKRQIVETRQIIKNTAFLLDSYFKNNNMDTKVYSVKAELNSSFRKQFGYPKGEGGRAINDFHHAKDAYITTIMGKYLLNRQMLDNIEALHLSGVFYNAKATKGAQNGFVLWLLKNETENDTKWSDEDSAISTAEALQNFDRNYYSADCFLSKKIDSKPTGAFYKETKFKNKKNAELWGEAFKKGMITIGKKGFGKELETEKYGGFSAVNPAKFAVIQKPKKNGFNYKFISIPTMVTCETATITEAEYLDKNYPGFTVASYIPKYAILTEESFGTAIISGEKDKYCGIQLQFSRENKELYKFIYLIFKYIEKINDVEIVNYTKWVNDKVYPILSREQKTKLDDNEQLQFAKNYVLDCVKRLKEEYLTHLRKNFIKKNLADIFEPYFDEMLSEGANLEKMLTIIPSLLKVTQCNGARCAFDSYSTEKVKLKGEIGRITDAIVNLDNTYIIHNSVTGIYSKKEKIIKNK